MVDYAEARRMMVDGQIRTSDVTDLRLLAAFLEVPRERFVPAARQSIAYLDIDVPVVGPAGDSSARCLIKPMVLAKLIQMAEIGAEDRVLDVGCATGYSAAVLAKLAAEVVAVEEHAGLAQTAIQTLASLGYRNVAVFSGALAAGWPAQAPYDAILVNGAIEVMPEALLRQLKEGGRLVGVVGTRPGKATLYRSIARHVTTHAVFDAAAPLLPGFAKPAEFVF